eukprot:CAMPEP_0197058282 /NCGR_PEP_ID=MMETSP1384-20130603/106011_1 /TAXON_ID=29189 /ORGANISM="Ammonia sp." /LENGTH=378 /DNA_ID=CAMNT_0042492977 /DNA_START=49 /DNA_END=1182 /DNA_ORIENTATION=-
MIQRSMACLQHIPRRCFPKGVQEKPGPGIGSYEQVEQQLQSIGKYEQVLDNKSTQIAVAKLKLHIEEGLCNKMNLHRVECPLIVDELRGVNDMLDRDGSRTPVGFYIKNDHEKHPVNAQVVQAATKWKRMALAQFDCGLHEGVYTDMRAVRKDYFLDHDHSCYVAQWDWEMVIDEEDRNLDFLFDVVRRLYSVIKGAEQFILDEYPDLKTCGVSELPDDIEFVHCQDLFDRWPDLDRKKRESMILEEKKAVFLCGIGYPMSDGTAHELRASDYDDWCTEAEWPMDGRTMRGLNGDILVWNQVTKRRHELSSMGIRVTKDTLKIQLKMSGQEDFLNYPYHQAILNDEIPLSIGGGIGQSRTFMYLLRKAHLGEIEISVW